MPGKTCVKFPNILLGLTLLLSLLVSFASSQSQLVPLVTDQTPLGLPNTFGPPQSSFVNQAGDYAFLGNGLTGVFFRPAGSSTSMRVIQTGEEVPGHPGSKIDVIPQLRLNNAGVIAFRPDFFQANGVGEGILFTFDGTTLTKVVAGGDQVPGGGGALFVRSITLFGLNDSGDIAFTAPLSTNQPTLFIIPGGGSPVRIAGLGDVAPDSSGGTFGPISPTGFNNLGEVLFRAALTGGSGGQGLFVGSVSGIRKVVASGDPRPEGGVFPAPGAGFINNTGQVAFQAVSHYIDTPGSGIIRAAGPGDPLTGATFGQISAVPGGALAAFSDAGHLAFTTNISGSAVTTFGLVHYIPGAARFVAAYRNQEPLGVPGRTLNNFTGISMNSGGLIAFQGTFLGAPALNGVFVTFAGGTPARIALDGDAIPLSGGGAYSIVNALTQALNDFVFFRTDVVGGTADYAEVLLIPGGPTKVLMNTADVLPAGSNVSLRSFRAAGAGDFVGFLALRAGGTFSIAVHDIPSQTTSVVASDGELAPGFGSGRYRITSRNTVFLTNAGGVVFSAQVIGGTSPGTTAFYYYNPGGGLTKIVANGDFEPVSGKVFNALSLNLITPVPVNASAEVAFFTNLIPVGPGTITRAIFVWTPGVGLAKVAAVGDLTSSGAAIVSFPAPNNFLSINSSGQVSFLASAGAGPGVTGIYVGSPGGVAAKVAAVGDATPSGGTYSIFTSPGLNDSGEVAFIAGVNGGPTGGAFVGSASTPPVALAVHGAAAPSGGNFSFTPIRPDIAINNQHDVVFRASLTGGASDSGYFVRRGSAGALQTVVLQGDPAPGTSGVFGTIIFGVNNFPSEQFQLSPTGDLAFSSTAVEGGVTIGGTWHVKPDNTIGEMLIRGSVDPAFGGGTLNVNTFSTGWNSGGRYPFWARVSNGTFTDAIFLHVPTIETSTPAGNSVQITPTDSTTRTTPVSMTFDTITQPGTTTVITSAGGPALPTAFSLGDPPVFYNIRTTAVFTGSIEVCVDFSNVTFPPGGVRRLLHFENGAWVDVTTSGPNGNVICGRVSSLSPFTVARTLDSDNDGIPDTCDLDMHPGATDVDQDGIVDGSGCDTQIGPPTNKDQCKKNGWRLFNFPRLFVDQGDCITFVNNSN